MEQSTSSNVEILLQELQSGGLISTRRDAALALGKLTESSEPIAIALMAAKESDDNSDVRQAAVEALLAPVHQIFIEQHPELAAKAAGFLQSRQAQKTQESEATKLATGSATEKNSNIQGWGGCLLLAGIVSLILPLFGYQLLLFRFIPTENPMWGIGLIIVGIILLVVGSR
jgi:hypothetical protein